MTPHIQRNSDDCYRTALACLLDMEPEEVPDFIRMGEDEFWDNVRKWLLTQGYNYYQVHYDGALQEILEAQAFFNESIYYLLSGVNKRGEPHVYIGLNDKIIHDVSGRQEIPAGPNGSHYNVEVLIPKQICHLPKSQTSDILGAMTTIVYRDGIIAYDSRLTLDDTIVNDKYNKLFKRKGVRFVLAGTADDFKKFITFYFIYRSGNKIPIEDINFECEGFVVDNKKLYIAECDKEQGYWTSECKLKDYWALGSGFAYAIGAMDMGATAKEALKVAKKRNTATGGRIRSIQI